MKKVVVFWSSLFTIIFSANAFACEPEVYFLFGSDAQNLLKRTDSITMMDRLVANTNLAFHKIKGARKQAQLLVDSLRQNDSLALLLAYWGALRIMEIRDWSIFEKLDNYSSLRYEVHLAYDSINAAVTMEPENDLIRFVRVTTALEVSKHYSEFLNYVPADLEWLTVQSGDFDRPRLFYLKLLSAKYYYWAGKRGKKADRQLMYGDAKALAESSKQFACRPVYKQQAEYWLEMIEDER